MLTERLVAKVRRDFPAAEAETVLVMLESAGEGPDDSGRERVQAAVVVLADGDSGRFLDALALAGRDWRDVLVAAELAEADWRERVARLLES